MVKEEEEEWKKWERVKYLTDRERDEIDLRARMILRRCKDRVGMLELAEQCEFVASFFCIIICINTKHLF